MFHIIKDTDMRNHDPKPRLAEVYNGIKYTLEYRIDRNSDTEEDDEYMAWKYVYSSIFEAIYAKGEKSDETTQSLKSIE